MPVHACREPNLDGAGTGRPGFRWNNWGEPHYYDPEDEAGRNAARAAAEADGEQDPFGHPDETALYPAPPPNPYVPGQYPDFEGPNYQPGPSLPIGNRGMASPWRK